MRRLKSGITKNKKPTAKINCKMIYKNKNFLGSVFCKIKLKIGS